MSLRDDLAGVLARDPRYPVAAYVFVFEALEHTQALRLRNQSPAKSAKRGGSSARKGGRADRSRHVTGRELCEGARDLALRLYGYLALMVLSQWGIRSTSDIGNIVYNLIESGDMQKTPEDSRADFDDVFEFAQALRDGYTLVHGDVA
jgi:uncharacterized repeat protein (TIGR04138 family)